MFQQEVRGRPYWLQQPRTDASRKHTLGIQDVGSAARGRSVAADNTGAALMNLPQGPTRVEPDGIGAKGRVADVRRDANSAERPGVGSRAVQTGIDRHGGPITGGADGRLHALVPHPVWVREEVSRNPGLALNDSSAHDNFPLQFGICEPRQPTMRG